MCLFHSRMSLNKEEFPSVNYVAGAARMYARHLLELKCSKKMFILEYIDGDVYSWRIETRTRQETR